MCQRVLVIGGDGLIGKAVALHLRSKGNIVVLTTRRKQAVTQDRWYLDLADKTDGWTPPERCDVAILCAAVTGYEACSLNPADARKVNVQGTFCIARTLLDSGAFVIQLSSNAVFDGKTPFRKPHEQVSPLTEYGRQKAEIEGKLLEVGGALSILRLTKVFPRLPSLLLDWISELRARRPISPFYDLTCAPLLIDQVVEVLGLLSKSRLPGICHLSGNRDVSYAELCHHLASRLRLDRRLIHPSSVRSSPLPMEHIPTYTSLDCSWLCSELGIEVPPLGRTVDALIGL